MLQPARRSRRRGAGQEFLVRSLEVLDVPVVEVPDAGGNLIDQIVLEANPDYRGFVWDFAPSDEPWDQALIAAMKGGGEIRSGSSPWIRR